MIPKRTYFKKYTNEEIINFIQTCNSASETVIKMGYDPSQRFFVKRFSEEYNITIDHFSRINQRTYSLNENFFETLNPISVYWLGFIMADGNVYNTKLSHSLKVHLAEKDLSHLEILKKDLNYSGKIRYHKPHIMTAKDHSYQAQSSYTLHISSKKITHDLISLDCIPNKTQFGTQISSRIPKELLRHFIRGYFDGDGSIVLGSHKNYLPQLSIFILGSEKILTQFADIISEELNVSKPTLSKRQGVYCLKWAGNNQCFKIYDWLYADAERYLERKYNKYIKHKSDYLEKQKIKDLEAANKLSDLVDKAYLAKDWKDFWNLIGVNSAKTGIKNRQNYTQKLFECNFDFEKSNLNPEL